MRIGLSTSVIQRGRTGVAQYVFSLLEALLAQPSPHRYVLFVLEGDRELFRFAEGRAEFVMVPERFRPPVANILWHQVELPGLVKRHRLELVHLPSYRRLMWRSPCPRVATIHDLAPFHVRGKYDWKRMVYGRVVVRRLAHRQEHIIAVSRSTARDIARFFGIPADRVNVVHNGIDHARFFPNPAAGQSLRRDLGLAKPFFLYVARLEHPGKNHVRLIRAFEQFKSETRSDWQLVLGGADWHGAQHIHHAIAASPWANDIKTLGFVGPEQLPDLYRAAEVFVYPSLFEGFGLPPIEAMACGCPVIASTRGALEEVVDGAAAVVNPEEIPSIARQLSVTATSAAARQRLQDAGLARAKEFNWERTASETTAIYETACNSIFSPSVTAARS